MCQTITPNYPKVLQRPDGRYEVVITIQGKRMRLQNGAVFGIPLKPNSFPTEQRFLQAQLLAAQIHQKLLLGELPQRKTTKAASGQPDLYYLEKVLHIKLAGNFSTHYKNALQLAYNLLIQHAHFQNITEEGVRHSLSTYQNNTSFNTVRRNMNILCRAAVQMGMKHNPVAAVSKKKENAKLNKPLDDVEALLEDIKNYNTKLYLCCLLTYGCLLRPHREIRELRWGDFSSDLSYISLSGARNKSKRNRIVPVPKYIRTQLQAGKTNHNIFTGETSTPNKDYFKTLWKRYKQTSTLLQQEHTLYSFRHSGAIDIYTRTGSIEKLRSAMGHSSILVSLTYLRGLEVAELCEEDMPILNRL